VYKSVRESASLIRSLCVYDCVYVCLYVCVCVCVCVCMCVCLPPCMGVRVCMPKVYLGGGDRGVQS